MEFGVVIETESHFANPETHINHNKIDLFTGWMTCMDSVSYNRRVFEFYLQEVINSPFSARRFVKRQHTKVFRKAYLDAVKPRTSNQIEQCQKLP